MDILLATINARYHHASLGLRYLFANLGALREKTNFLEFTLSQSVKEMTDEIMKENPKILGLGVYIWNVQKTLELVCQIQHHAPEIKIVLGGPEVSYESENQKICHLADHVIQGEADLVFSSLCQNILAGIKGPKFLRAEPPSLAQLHSPYSFYTEEDIRNRTLYVEASRGCPFHCEFCLSALDESVRTFSLPAFLKDLQWLLMRGARQFKFVDRTFNLNPRISTAILQFFLNHKDANLFLHFEMIPDRLPPELKELIVLFPRGSLQFEIGIQTFNAEVSKRISRRQNYEKIRENLHFLLQKTGVYVHVDLIAGLPGEDEESFALGFDELLSFQPHEIQVGILKRLKGTPIIRHDQAWQMLYDENPPFAILQTKTMSSDTLERIERFAKFWDKIGNSGDFFNTLALLKAHAKGDSFYHLFMRLSEALFQNFQRTHSIDLTDLSHALLAFLQNSLHLDPEKTLPALAKDFSSHGKRNLPPFLQSVESLKMENSPALHLPHRIFKLPKRQQKHLQWQNQPD